MAQGGHIREVHPNQKNAALALGMLVLSYPVYRLMKLASRRQSASA